MIAPAPFAPEPPEEFRPRRLFDDERVRAALPEGRFTLDDLRITRWWRARRA